MGGVMAINTAEFMKSFKNLVSMLNNKNVTLPKAISMITAFIATIEKEDGKYLDVCKAIQECFNSKDNLSSRISLISAIKGAVLNNLTFNESEKNKYLSSLSITKKIAREGWIAPTPAAKKTSAGIASAITAFAWDDKKTRASKPIGGVIPEILGGQNTGATAAAAERKKKR